MRFNSLALLYASWSVVLFGVFSCCPVLLIFACPPVLSRAGVLIISADERSNLLVGFRPCPVWSGLLRLVTRSFGDAAKFSSVTALFRRLRVASVVLFDSGGDSNEVKASEGLIILLESASTAQDLP